MTAVPQRMCVACRNRRAQSELLRFTRRRDGEVVAAPARAHGRSAYVCPSRACIQRAVVRRSLVRSLHSGGHVVREISGADDLITATERALDRQTELLAKTSAKRCPRLPQLQALRHALRPERTT